jgi:leader peptidase (prepilin peptidase) / N-methyltransferase
VESIIAFIIGVCVGSFGNVLIDRLPAGRTILGRSRCDGCNRTLTPSELVPIASWVYLRGRCRSCASSITVRVPFVELVSGVMAVAAVVFAGSYITAAFFFIALWALLLIAVIDARTGTIPDLLTCIAFIAATLFQWFTLGVVPIVAPLIAAGFFFAQWSYSRGRWVGSGDIALAAVIGMLIGTTQGVVWMLLFAYIIGATVAIVLLLTRCLSRKDTIPFGPFLVAAGYAVLFLGETLPMISLW